MAWSGVFLQVGLDQIGSDEWGLFGRFSVEALKKSRVTGERGLDVIFPKLDDGGIGAVLI